MKNAIIAALTIAGLVAAAVFTFLALASGGEKEAARIFDSIEPQADFNRRYRPVAAKNASAARLEELSAAVEIELRPHNKAPHPAVDGKAAERERTISSWLRTQQERDDDSIDALPGDVEQWLADRRAAIDAVASHLVTAEAPLWPLLQRHSRLDQPLPNLLGYMKLQRLLGVAALAAESQGEHERAWRLQHAAWRLTQAIQERPELISRLVAIGGLRSEAGSMRKLEPPVPTWVSEMSALRLRGQMLDSVRYELETTHDAVTESPLDLFRSNSHEGLGERARDVAMSPLLRWVAADMSVSTSRQMVTLSRMSPCSIDGKAAERNIQSDLSPLAQRFSGFMTPNLINAFVRAANTEIALEGTSKVLALKVARDDAAGRWPDSLPRAGTSTCTGAEWAYENNPAAVPRLHFTGKVPEPPGFKGTRIPLDFMAR